MYSSRSSSWSEVSRAEYLRISSEAKFRISVKRFINSGLGREDRWGESEEEVGWG